MIVLDNDKYKLYSKDGKKLLGTFPTRKSAEEREKQINMMKHIKGGK